MLLLGVFGDPGIKKETYLHYTKNWFSDGKDLYTQDSSDSEEKVENVDEESGIPTKASPNTVQRRQIHRKETLQKAQKQQRYRPQYEEREDSHGNKIKVLYCIKCNVDMTKDMDHCSTCDVCVYGYDHHCVFFSKCIGGGNMKCFCGSICLVVFNLIMVLCILIGTLEEPGSHARPSIKHVNPMNEPIHTPRRGRRIIPQPSKSAEIKEELDVQLENQSLNLQTLMTDNLKQEIKDIETNENLTISEKQTIEQ